MTKAVQPRQCVGTSSLGNPIVGRRANAHDPRFGTRCLQRALGIALQMWGNARVA